MDGNLWLRIACLRRWVARIESGHEDHKALVPSLVPVLERRKVERIAALRQRISDMEAAARSTPTEGARG